MENLTALQEKFNDIFRYQIENNGRKSKITRSEFWDDIYFHRDNDTSTFDIFINSDCPVLFVTGMVGTGKSTFVRSIYEKARLCTGIIIDFKGHSDKFQIDEEDVIENTIKIILEESLLNLIRENIKYRLIKNIPSFIDLHYDPKFIIENIDPSDWNSPYWEFMTNQEVFLLAMSNLHSFTEISNFAYENGLMPGKDHKDFLETCRKKIEANSNLLSNLLKLLDWKKLLELLRIISDRQEVFVLCFDNIDAIKFSKIQEHFLEALINVSNIANNSKANGNITALNSTPIKIVLNVRDENISRLNLSAAGTKRHMQIMLNEDCKVLDIASEKKYLTKSKEFFFEIINRRLDKIILNYNNSEEFSAIIKLIKSQILDIENKNLRQGDDFVNIRELSNESIRLMLDLISDLAFSIFELINLNSINIDDYHKINHLVKGKLIQYLYLFDTTNTVIKSIGNSMRKEQNYEGFCCSFRMCLTYLYNCRDFECTVEDLKSDMKLHLNVNEVTLKSSLFNLYNTGNRESEIITIYQNEIIKSPDSITDQAIIKLNIKGEQILNNVIKHMDFYGKLTEQSHLLKNKCLFELMPEEALTYIGNIYAFIENTFKYHKHFIENNIFPRLQSLNYTQVFEKYSEHYCVGKSFYLERVCGSHINYIKKYITEILRGEEGLVLVPKIKRLELNKYKLIDSQENAYFLPLDGDLRNVIKQQGLNSIIKNIFSFIEKYENIQKEVQLFRYNNSATK